MIKPQQPAFFAYSHIHSEIQWIQDPLPQKRSTQTATSFKLCFKNTRALDISVDYSPVWESSNESGLYVLVPYTSAFARNLERFSFTTLQWIAQPPCLPQTLPDSFPDPNLFALVYIQLAS